MTGPHPEAESKATRPISVAELLARNGTIGAPAVTRRHGRRRGDNDSVTVAELTGEIPIISDDHHEHQDLHGDEDLHDRTSPKRKTTRLTGGPRLVSRRLASRPRSQHGSPKTAPKRPTGPNLNRAGPSPRR